MDREDIRLGIRNIMNLPTLPVIMSRVLEVADDSGSSANELADIVSKDMSVSAKVLNLANLTGDLKIQPVKVGFAAFYESIGRVDLMEHHKDEDPVFISGKKVRELLGNGEAVDLRIMRPSTSQILSEAMAPV
tara:strand:- start:5596 stop:5994 length:399 start_codon:yes stop_codon:yes gene_type:complete